jgi:hypothetical protein
MYELPASPNIHQLNFSIRHKFSNAVAAFYTRKRFTEHNFASCNSLNFNGIMNPLGCDAVYEPSFSPGFSAGVARCFTKVIFPLYVNISAFFLCYIGGSTCKAKYVNI